MKNTIEFLQFRESLLNIEAIETNNNCRLPPVYRAFITVFKPYFKNVEYYDEMSDLKKGFLTDVYSSIEKESYTIDDDELSLESFMEVSDSFKYESFENYRKDLGLIPIAFHGHGGGLMVGINEENSDKIYLIKDSTEFKFMANNIFELIQKMDVVIANFDDPSFDATKLYKNWGEDFWRVKEDDT